MKLKFIYTGHGTMGGSLKLNEKEPGLFGSCLYELFSSSQCHTDVELDINSCFAEDFVASYIKATDDPGA